jgi:hypothetical protein
MNIPQPTDRSTIRLLEDLTRRVDDLTTAMRHNNIQSSPTVRVEKTAVGTTLHAAPAAPPTTATAQKAVWRP